MTESQVANPSAATVTPSQAVVEVLREQGVEMFFGLDGDHMLNLYDALAAAPDIRPITVRHENNAAIAAEVYGRLTGRPGVLITTAGPGATNALTGIAGAYAAGAPIVHISGGVARGAPKEAFHGVDETDFLQRAFEPVTKWSVRLEEPSEIPAALRRAFALAASGRPGPVRVEIALSALQGQPIALPPPSASDGIDLSAAAPPALDALASRLDAAARIAIVAGKNAWWPPVSAALVMLAERLGAPVAHTWDGQAAMPTVHPLSIGPWGSSTGSHPAADAAVRAADIVLGVGVRRGTQAALTLAEQVGDRLVLVDAVDHPGSSDDIEARSVPRLAALLVDLAERCEGGPADQATLESCARARAMLQRGLDLDLARHQDARPWHIGLALAALARRMTPETLVISDVSNVKLWAPLQLPVFNPESHLQPGSWGGMGYALPGVLAAALARPERRVVGLCGDTSFLMASSDFATICQLGLPVVLAVHNDGQIGMIDNAMTMLFGRPYATQLTQVDLVQYARAFGARGLRVDDPADLDAAWDEALQTDGPLLLELRAGFEFPRPWPVERLVHLAG